MPDQDAKTSADEETLPETSLHAYSEGREEDVQGDLEKLKAGDPKHSQRVEIEDDAGDSDDIIKPPEKA